MEIFQIILVLYLGYLMVFAIIIPPLLMMCLIKYLLKSRSK
jgi:hypothetical protein